MPELVTSYWKDEPTDTIRVDWQGALDPEEIDCLFRKLKEQPYFSNSSNSLWDFSGAYLDGIYYADADAMVANFKPEILKINGRVAIVAPHDAVFGYSRMYVALATNARPDYQIQVFRGKAAARQWIASGRL